MIKIMILFIVKMLLNLIHIFMDLKDMTMNVKFNLISNDINQNR